MEIGSVSKLLSGSKFADHAKEIEAVFDQLGIKTLDDLDNAPRKLGPRTIVYSTYQLCAYLRQAMIQAVIEGPVEVEPPEPEPEPVAEEVVVVLEQVEEIEPEERSEE